MSEIELLPASPSQRMTLENLLQLYIHDFSEYRAGRPEGELDQHGRFPDYPLDAYWQHSTHVPLLIRRSESLLGFALMNAVSHSGRFVDRNVAEFFIVRKHRRSGAGRAAAHALFQQHPGQWECAVARRNVAALGFWRKTIASSPAVRDIEELDLNDGNWNGPVIRFRIIA